MKLLHRPDLYSWSVFDEGRNLDFHGTLWVRPEGNVVIDPVPMSEHDQRHLSELGGALMVVVTNSDHVRAALQVARATGARVAGPRGEQGAFPIPCERWLADGEEPLPGLRVLELHGSKTPGELALLIHGTTLVVGDLVRAHAGGRLDLLPDPKLTDPGEARQSVRRLAALDGVEAVLTGDGWPVFRDGSRLLGELVGRL